MCLFPAFRLKSTLSQRVLTPVRRSDRIERAKSKLPPSLQEKFVTVSSPSELAKEVKNGDIYFLPNLAVDTPLNNAWSAQAQGENIEEKDLENEHELSFC